MRVLFRAWVFVTVLIGLVIFAIMPHGFHNPAALREWFEVTASVSGFLFAVGYGLIWIARGAG